MINTRVDVRPATVDDLAAVNDIYNQFVAETHYTFDIEPMTMDARQEWFTHYDTTGRHRLVVAVSDGRGFRWTSDRLRVQQPVPT